jgi:signal transduction histidine kinase
VRQDGRVIVGVRARLKLLLWSIAATMLAALSLVLFVLMITSTALIAVWVGVPVLLNTAEKARVVADLHRRQVGHIDGKGPIESLYLKRPDDNMLVRVRALLGDPARRRDATWLGVNGSLGLALAIIGIVESVLDLIFWWLPPALALRAHAALARSLLSVSEKSRLALRVQQLTESRAETVDTQAAELRRIERDLHDGAQARLVSLGMSLAMAEQVLARDPDAARTLLAEARESTSKALTELRDLVRGIHPPVLADRGLVEAVRALALALPIPVEVQANFSERLSAPVESASYFAAAEALTNVVKHASARHVSLRLTRTDDAIEILVEDDGVGRADPANGTGLRGVARRLAAFDGSLTVDSPDGGPTKVVMVLPCAPSSPKISHSSGTA